MRRLILALALLTLFFVPVRVTAQGDLHLNSVNVAIWPEYDQPAVLLIYRIILAAGSTLPANLTVRIPAGAQINAVAVVDPTAGLVNTPYDSSVQGQWSILKIAATSMQVQVEFYTALNKNGKMRHIVFEWPGDYAVDVLDINFLQPFSATNVVLSTPPTDTGAGQDGLTNYHVQKNNLTAGQSYSLTIDYQRNTDDLSISSLPVQAASTPGPETPGRTSMNDILPWLLAGLGLVLIAAGVIGYIIWQRGGAKRPIRKQKNQNSIISNDESIYCHQCGKRAQPGDIFCRTCGTRLKRDGSE